MPVTEHADADVPGNEIAMESWGLAFTDTDLCVSMFYPEGSEGSKVGEDACVKTVVLSEGKSEIDVRMV